MARQQGQSNKDPAIEVSAPALCKSAAFAITEVNHRGKAFAATDFVQDGSIIDLGGRLLEALHVPEDTPDAIALIDRDAGLMWTGGRFYHGPIWLYAVGAESSFIDLVWVSVKNAWVSILKFETRTTILKPILGWFCHMPTFEDCGVMLQTHHET